MNILKIINNNVVSALDDKGKEIIVTGKGIGFQKKPKDAIEEDRIEKVFRLDDSNVREFEELLADIPYEHVQLVVNIVGKANNLTEHKLNKSIYISLLDHIHYAIKRVEDGIEIENSLLWEIKRFYSKEYGIGLEALSIIKEEIGVDFPEDEAGFIAMHILNAELGSHMRKTSLIPDMFKNIYNIVGYAAKHKIDDQSIYYDRFVMHIKYLMERISKNEMYNGLDGELYDLVTVKYPESFRCALRIQTYLKKKIDYDVPDEELAYLTIHIENLLRHEQYYLVIVREFSYYNK